MRSNGEFDHQTVINGKVPGQNPGPSFPMRSNGEFDHQMNKKNRRENGIDKKMIQVWLALGWMTCAILQSAYAQDNYKPPKFVADDRMEKILTITREVEELLEENALSSHIPGVVFGIVVDDSLIFSCVNGVTDLEEQSPVTRSSAFRIASMTKSFTAMAVMILRDQGKLSLQDPVSLHLPEINQLELPTSDSPAILIEHLLTMTAGFPEDNPWGDRQLDEPVAMLSHLIAKGISFSRVPGESYEYSNTGYAILGMLVSRVSGMPYQEFIRQEIFIPLGMEYTCWEYERVPVGTLAKGYRYEDMQWKSEPILHDGSYGAMGGLITTLGDFARYVSFHLSAWPARNTKDGAILKRSSLRQMHLPHHCTLDRGSQNNQYDPCPSVSGYGYGLRISIDCMDIRRIQHGGALPGYGSSYVFYPDYGVGMMAFGNLTYTSPWPLRDLEQLLFSDAGIQPRQIQASGILLKRQMQVSDLLLRWAGRSGELYEWKTDQSEMVKKDAFLAENFYLDLDRAHRAATAIKLFNEAGKVIQVGAIKPHNQLRGQFPIYCEKDTLEVFFTLSPEPEPKVQQLILQ